MKLLLLLLFTSCLRYNGQLGKVYKNVDTINVYNDREIIVFRNRYNRTKKDTLLLSKTRYDTSLVKRGIVINVYHKKLIN